MGVNRKTETPAVQQREGTVMRLNTHPLARDKCFEISDG